MKVTGVEVSYDLRAFRENADATQNPVLDPGDRVSVGREVGAVLSEYRVSGAVKNAGYFPLDDKRETRVLDAIEACGRWTDEANPRLAELVRKDGSKFTLDLTTLDGDPAGDNNKILKDGDELFLPRNPVQVVVLGGVKKEGPYHVPAVLRSWKLLRPRVDSRTTPSSTNVRWCATSLRRRPGISINLDSLMHKGDMTQNPVLVDRDIVYVGRRNPTDQSKPFLDTLTDTVSRYWWLFKVW